MRDWERKKLKEICSYLNRGVTPLYADEGILIINQKCVRDNRLSLDQARKSSFAKKIPLAKILRIGDILVNSTGFGTLGRTAPVKHLDEDCSVDTHVTIVRPIESVNSTFIGYQLSFREPVLSGLGKGATQQTELSRDDLGNVDIFLPSRGIQDKIASMLSSYDDLIEKNLRRIKLLEETARITYEEWFVTFTVNGQKLKIKNGLPLGWKTKKLEDVLKLNYGKALKSDNRIDGKYPVYGSSGIVGKHNEAIAKGPGIILGRKGNVGSVFWSDEDFYPIDTVYFISAEISLYYLYFNLLTQNFVNSDAAVPGLNRSAAYRNPIVVPPNEIAQEFERLVKPYFDLVSNLGKQNALLKEARDILLPRLMSGVIDVRGEEKIEIKVIAIEEEKPRAVNWEFKEAVLIAMLTERFGTKQFPLGRKRYTKFSYLFHRHVDNQVEHYRRKAAGPYNPKTKYQGPEKIAHENGYVDDFQNGNLTGFIPGKNISAAKTYFEKYWSMEHLTWLEYNFRFKKNDELELYATVDNALLELHRNNEPINVEAVKTIIRTEKEWRAKLERETFSDINIQSALNYLLTIFQYP